MVIETLAQAIRKNIQIKGYPLPEPALRDEAVKLSLYADDITIFLDFKYKTESLKQLQKIINIYQQASGSQINLDKSELAVFGGTNETYTNTALAAEMANNTIYTTKPIDQGVKLLGIYFYDKPHITYENNYSIILLKMERHIAFLRMRKLL